MLVKNQHTIPYAFQHAFWPTYISPTSADLKKSPKDIFFHRHPSPTLDQSFKLELFDDFTHATSKIECQDYQ